MNFLPWIPNGSIQGFEPHHGQEILFSITSGPTLVPSLLFRGYRGYFPEVKCSGVMTTCLHLVSGVKNEWSYTSAPPVCLYGGDGYVTLFTFCAYLPGYCYCWQLYAFLNAVPTDRNCWFEFPTQKSVIFCAWVVAVMTSWDAGVSLSLSHPPLLSLPQDLAPWMALDLCQAHVKYQTCRPFSYFWHESKSRAVSAVDTDRTVPSVAGKWPIISRQLVVGLYWNVQRHVGTYIILLTSSCFRYLGRNVPVIFTFYSFFLQKICRFSHYTVCDFWQEHWKETKERNT